MHLYDERASCGDHVLDLVAAVDLEGREARRVEVLADDHKPILLQRCTRGAIKGTQGEREGYARGTRGVREGYARGTRGVLMRTHGATTSRARNQGVREGYSCLQPVRGDVRQALVRPLLAMQHRPADVRLPCRAAKRMSARRAPEWQQG